MILQLLHGPIWVNKAKIRDSLTLWSKLPTYRVRGCDSSPGIPSYGYSMVELHGDSNDGGGGSDVATGTLALLTPLLKSATEKGDRKKGKHRGERKRERQCSNNEGVER